MADIVRMLYRRKISPFNDELHVVPVEGATLSGLSANSDASTVVFRVAIVSRYPDR